MYTLLYLRRITSKDLYSTGNSAQCYMAACMGGEFWGRLDTCIYMTEYLCCAPQTITTSLINYNINKVLKKVGIAIYLSLLRHLIFCSYVNILLNNPSTVMDQSEYMKGDIKDIIGTSLVA